MPTIAYDVLEWVETHPNTPQPDIAKLLRQVPPAQWSGEHWAELSKLCPNRIEIRDEPRFMNRLGFYRIQPLPRCLFRSPDGRGLMWLKSGGDVESYGVCEKRHCARTQEGASHE